MPDWLSIAERGLKAVRYGIFQASDNISLLLDGLCCAPEESKGDCGSCGRPKDAAHRPDCCNPDAREFAFDDVPTNRRATPAQFLAAYGRIPSYARDSAAASPAAAVVAPSPKQGSDSGPADSDILTSPAGPPQTHQKSEGCWCGERLDAEGSESAVLMACSHFRIAHCHREPIETGHDMGGRWAAEMFPQYQKPQK